MNLSVIIPVRNGGEELCSCLKALVSSSRQPDEIIVIDDGSTDDSAQTAASFGAHLLTIKGASLGPAAARNRGAAAACGDLLVFIDADIVVHADVLGKIDQKFRSHPEIAALFGSYDAHPPHRSLISLYKNLQHYFVHQHGKQEATTFWTGIGAIRREVFIRLGGFDERYRRPSIEDIELGTRLRGAGYRVWLCPDIQVTHLKRWTFLSWLRADIFDRAVPWVRLVFSTRHLPADLNLDYRSRLSAFIVWLIVALLAAGIVWLPAWIGALFLLLGFALLNRDLYRLFAHVGGLWFAVRAFGLHMFYFLYSSLTFGIVSSWLFFTRLLKT